MLLPILIAGRRKLTGIFRMIDLNRITRDLDFYSLNVLPDAVNIILITYMTVNFHNFFNTGWFH